MEGYSSCQTFHNFFKGEKKVKALLCLLYYDKQREVQVDVCSSIQFCRYDLNFNFMMSAVYCLTMGKNLSSLQCAREVKAAEKGPLLRPSHWSTSLGVDVKLIVVVTLMFSPSLFSLLSTLMLPPALTHCAKTPFFVQKVKKFQKLPI